MCEVHQTHFWNVNLRRKHEIDFSLIFKTRSDNVFFDYYRITGWLIFKIVPWALSTLELNVNIPLTAQSNVFNSFEYFRIRYCERTITHLTHHIRLHLSVMFRYSFHGVQNKRHKISYDLICEISAGVYEERVLLCCVFVGLWKNLFWLWKNLTHTTFPMEKCSTVKAHIEK